MPVARSSSGRLRGFRSLAARAPAIPSRNRPDSGTQAGEVVKVELRLGGPAGSVRGVVLGPDDVPVMGAAVEMLAPPIRSVTDDRGVFAIGSLPPGENAIEVRMPGFAPWKGAARVTAGEETAVEVRLQKEAAVFGTARLVSGAPVADVAVWVGVRGHFLSSTTYSGADGSFRLGSLAPGRVEISASSRQTGKAAATLDARRDRGAMGSRHRPGAHDRRLRPRRVGQAARGVGRHGAVERSPRPERRRRRARRPTSADGSRSSAAPMRGPIGWRRGRRSGRTEKARAYLDGVTPGDVEHVIRVSTKVMGIIKGRVIRHDGTPAAAEVMLRTERDDRAAFVKTDPKTGAFSSPWLVPGRWRVTVEKDRVGNVEGGEHDLGPGETLDLGDIKLPEPGTLVIDLEAPEAIADQVVYSILPKVDRNTGRIPTWIRHARSRSRTRTSRSRSRFRRALTPSMSRGRAWRDSSLAFTIEPGKETRVAVARPRWNRVRGAGLVPSGRAALGRSGTTSFP